ncbi:HsmA family protein [Propioniciclava soli]|uniref:HsmA family protein n=1 Tax=Propioniciclava soli TaxID=2775081 RepID=A0ABZ3C830_9ACTN|nr:HsmA family protein [Propioniciclava soli]
MLVAAIILISLALVAYTAGVWAERIAGRLRPFHVVLFGAGLAFDASGTWLMSLIAQAGTHDSATATGGVLMNVMAVTGLIALVLMAVHFLWAVVVLVRNRDAELRTFHRLSVIVWAIWLIPYFTGMIGAML